jgi:hypothetical protein
MFIKRPIDAKLDAEIQSALKELQNHEKTSEEYATLVDRISELSKLRTESKFQQISPDTVIFVAANLFGILWLTSFEREHVIPSRAALGLINLRPR